MAFLLAEWVDIIRRERGDRSLVPEYNPYGEKTKTTDALGNATAYEYDNGGNLVKVTDALGIITTYGYNKAGNKLYMTDGRGKTTNYSYNGDRDKGTGSKPLKKYHSGEKANEVMRVSSCNFQKKN